MFHWDPSLEGLSTLSVMRPVETDENIHPANRVGWPPTPQVFEGPRDRGYVIYIHITVGFLNMCACYLHLYFKKLRSHPQPGPSRATISYPLGSSQWVLFYLFPRVGPPKLGNFK